MKRVLLLTCLLLFSGCNSVSNTSGKGKLVEVIENPSYYIKYDTHTYVIIREVDNEKHEILKSDEIPYNNVFYLEKDFDRYFVNSEYLVYERTNELLIYYKK